MTVRRLRRIIENLTASPAEQLENLLRDMKDIVDPNRDGPRTQADKVFNMNDEMEFAFRDVYAHGATIVKNMQNNNVVSTRRVNLFSGAANKIINGVMDNRGDRRVEWPQRKVWEQLAREAVKIAEGLPTKDERQT